MAETVFNVAKQRIMQGLTDLDGGDLRAVLITGNKTGVNVATLTDLAAIDALNAGATNFNANRIVMTSLAVTIVTGAGQAGAATITFPAEAVVALGILIFDNNAQAGTPPTGDGSRFPIMFSDTGFGAGVDLTSGGMTYSLPNGWLRGT
jgi:hypothetical protein